MWLSPIRQHLNSNFTTVIKGKWSFQFQFYVPRIHIKTLIVLCNFNLKILSQLCIMATSTMLLIKSSPMSKKFHNPQWRSRQYSLVQSFNNRLSWRTTYAGSSDEWLCSYSCFIFFFCDSNEVVVLGYFYCSLQQDDWNCYILFDIKQD